MMIKSNFCHAIKCSRADKHHLKDVWKCIESSNDQHDCRCHYFETNGEVDLLTMKRIELWDEWMKDYRTEFQIITALVKSKYNERK